MRFRLGLMVGLASVMFSACDDAEGVDTADAMVVGGQGGEGGEGGEGGAACDDADGDGACDDADNCPADANADQADADADGEGDACDADRDGDGADNMLEVECQSDPDDAASTPPDADEDGACDTKDNCPDAANADQADQDDDTIGDACDPDRDGDGVDDEIEAACGSDPADAASTPVDGDDDAVCDAQDNCPADANADQADLDVDGTGDACDDDRDGDDVSNDDEAACGSDPDDDGSLPPDDDDDGVCNPRDNCPEVANDDQADLDEDSLGDACDDDRDGDGALNDLETACGSDPTDAASAPVDGDGDGVCDGQDNCPAADNADQADLDEDGVGDACDDDRDGDGALNAAEEACESNPDDAASAPVDGDDDGVCDPLDNCPALANAEQADLDADGTGDVCDDDRDGDDIANADEEACESNPDDAASLPVDGDDDGLCDALDNCPADSNADQADADADGAGDVCDNCAIANPDQLNSDADALGDACDNCPADDNIEQADQDEDGVGDACDDDIDGDTVLNADDNCVDVPNPDQANTDALAFACGGEAECEAALEGCDWVQGPSSTYLACDAGRDWNAAQAFCEAQGGNLVIIDDADENAFVFETFRNERNIWLGLSDQRREGTFVRSDGVPLAYTNWRGVEPNDASGREDCAQMQGDAGWNDVPCANNISITICELSDDGRGDACDNCVAVANADQSDLDDDGLGDRCDDDRDADGVLDADDNCVEAPNPDQLNSDAPGAFTCGDEAACELETGCDWVQSEEGSVYLICPGGQNWNGARANCQAVGGDLAVVEDAAENDFLFAAFLDGGLDLEHAYIGFSDRVVEGRFDWVDGVLRPYTNWAPNEPSDSFRGEDCAALRRGPIAWNDLPCDDDTAGYICEVVGDALGDACDVCPDLIDPYQRDNDADGMGDLCDDDDDNDGASDEYELACGTPPFTPGPILPDTDEDGVCDAADVCPDLADPEQSDIDRDGLGDLCDDDIDGDGLGNAEEAELGSDPLLLDSDDDGRSDFEEVVGDNTDPTNAVSVAYVVGATVRLDDGDGFLWDLRANGEVGNGSIDAFDGYAELRIDGQRFQNRQSGVLRDAGRTLLIGPAPFGDVAASREIYVPGNTGYARFVETIYNRTDAPIEVTVALDGNLGSDGATLVAADASADGAVGIDDAWFVSDDAADGEDDPAIGHAYGDPDAVAPMATQMLQRDSADWSYVVEVPANGQARVMWFMTQQTLRADAEARITAIADAVGDFLAGLDAGEIASIVNWVLPE